MRESKPKRYTLTAAAALGSDIVLTLKGKTGTEQVVIVLEDEDYDALFAAVMDAEENHESNLL
jgi:hypothetical protein